VSHRPGNMRASLTDEPSSGDPVGLHVWRSERADGLLQPLAHLLADPPADPFAPEMVAVPTAGIERWLTQELSLRLGTLAAGRTDGVCANVDFPFPGSVIARALEAAGDLPQDSDVWRPERLVWPLLSLAAAQPDADWWGPARSHLDSPDDGRRYTAARRIADLLDRYAVHRPEMVRAWAGGDDLGPDLEAIPPAHAWQPRLWRELRRHLATPSTAERLGDAASRLAAGEVTLDLPGRLSVFGLTALPSSFLQVLTAVAAQRDVHLFLLHPSPELWERVEGLASRQQLVRGPRDDDPTSDLAEHPLLRSWGRDAREMQTVFAALGAPSARHQAPGEPARGSLLARLQADIRADRSPAGPPVGDEPDRRPALAPDDRSIQVHASHGRMRQVQVLRDAILHLLARHEDLEPRDIIVMCPDVETFAPFIDAVFGAQVAASDHDGSPALRVRIADRSLRQTNPVLKVVAEVLDLADARLTGPEVFDLLSRGPVRRRFRFDDADLERIETWIPDLGIRWGLDADDRSRFDLGGVDANTWRFGLQRLLTGVAMADQDLRLIADTVPYDDVEGNDVELAGRFAECVDRLTAVLTELRAPRPLAAWRDVLVRATDRLTDTSDADAWQQQQLRRLLDDLVEQAAHAPEPTELSLAEVRVLLGDHLRGRPTRASHRTGDLTVSTLVPMRAVPHRVVCLLGMDDGSFPRRTVPDGDDLVDLVPFVGDRDARTEDRQLLLDALLAATDHLVVTYSARDERTNEPLPPAVPIGELLDVIDATVRPADPRATRARASIVVPHPLQAFDPRNFRDDDLGVDGPWSFDEVALSGALAHAKGLSEPSAFLSAPLPPRAEDLEVIELSQLVRFFEHPVRTFLAERLGVWLSTDADGPQDGIPIDLTGLPRWQIGDRLLTALREGRTRDEWERVERVRGTLPPDPLATAILDEVCPIAEDILAAADDLIGDAPTSSTDLDLVLPGGRRLIGTVGQLSGDTIGLVSYSSIKAKTRLAAYVRLVALTAAQPEVPWRAVLVCRLSRTKKNVEYCVLGPLADDPDGRAKAADAALARLLDLFDRGMRAPAPLYGETSERIAREVAAGKGPWGAAKAWETDWLYPNDDLDPCHITVLGGVATFAELLDAAPEPDEVGEDWPACAERIVAWARRLWEPVIAIEEGGRR
jgi:exodeoxyribonuclease V gamma subunit